MAPPLDAQTAEERARALLDNRINSVRTLVATRQRLADLHEQLATTEADDVKAYRAALGDGWTADELRSLGIDEPAKKARTRRRAARKAAASSPAPAPAAGGETGDTDA